MITAYLYKRIAFCKNPEYHTTAMILFADIELPAIPRRNQKIRIHRADAYMSGKTLDADAGLENIQSWDYNDDGSINIFLDDLYGADGDVEKLKAIEDRYTKVGFVVDYEFDKYKQMKEQAGE